MRVGRFFSAGLFGILMCIDTCGWSQEVDVASVAVPTTSPGVGSDVAHQADVTGHPLDSALELAHEKLTYIRANVRDYTCLLIKRERIQGELLPFEYIRVKCRPRQAAADGQYQPLSIYMKYAGPKEYRGREVLFVEDRDGGKMLVRKGGGFTGFLNLRLDPNGAMAMSSNRHSVLEFGIEPLVTRLIDVGQHDRQYDECEVKQLPPTKINDRVCIGIEVRHPFEREHFAYHIARIFWDDALHVPIHFEMYHWPSETGRKPQLLELYSFRDLKLNVGLQDLDFDRENPEYGFGGKK